jgi:membrane AbrB-like protein
MAAEAPAPGRGAAWARLLLLSAALTGALEIARLPAAFLLGPMAAAIALAVRGERLAVPEIPFAAAQALVGCLIAASMSAGLLRTVAADWPLFVAVTAATLGASSLLGYLLSRWQVLPGTAAIWGSTPGAATAMVLMARAYGADERRVAVMTYSRVVCVAVLAALLALVLGGHGAPRAALLAPVRPPAMLATFAVAAAGAWLGIRLRLPAGTFLGPMLLGAAASLSGLLRLELPPLLLALSYAVVGWKIGLGFTRETVRVALRALPRILASILLLIGFCAALGLALSRVAQVDPVTAFLATSPGGMDSIAIIAASTRVDIPFVMALQMVRFLGVLLLGPALARWVAERQRAREAQRAAFAPPLEPLEKPND